MSACPAELTHQLGYSKNAGCANAIESLNMSLRKLIKPRGSFPSEEVCLKLLYLGLKNVAKKWTMPIPDWGLAMNQFVIMVKDRIQPAELHSFTQNF